MTVASVQDKHILITGGASGIGAASASLLASRGAKVTVADMNVELGESLVKQINEQGHVASFVPVDVSEADSVASLFAAAKDNYGPVNIVINNAGIDHLPGALADLDDAVWHKNIAVNLTGVWYCMKQSVKQMLSNGGGHIINISSVAGIHSAPLVAPYCAAKHGVIGLTKTAAVEYAKANIRVNAVCPSFIRTPMVEKMLEQVGEKMATRLIKGNPMKRLGEADEIAATIAWLCSDESSFMTGHNVVLDGGMTA
ncbi:SDR family oxidoreductase [Alteromonadaceae bacterium M269]|nr:SDR family oxidoreductase [Alteromonadaceae bacterium M269]